MKRDKSRARRKKQYVKAPARVAAAMAAPLACPFRFAFAEKQCIGEACELWLGRCAIRRAGIGLSNMPVLGEVKIDIPGGAWKQMLKPGKGKRRGKDGRGKRSE